MDSSLPIRGKHRQSPSPHPEEPPPKKSARDAEAKEIWTIIEDFLNQKGAAKRGDPTNLLTPDAGRYYEARVKHHLANLLYDVHFARIGLIRAASSAKRATDLLFRTMGLATSERAYKKCKGQHQDNGKSGWLDNAELKESLPFWLTVEDYNTIESKLNALEFSFSGFGTESGNERIRDYYKADKRDGQLEKDLEVLLAKIGKLANEDLEVREILKRTPEMDELKVSCDCFLSSL